MFIQLYFHHYLKRLFDIYQPEVRWLFSKVQQTLIHGFLTKSRNLILLEKTFHIKANCNDRNGNDHLLQ